MMTLFFQPLSLLLLVNVSLLDQGICGCERIVMQFEHTAECSDVMIHFFLVTRFNIFKSANQVNRDKLVQLI